MRKINPTLFCLLSGICFGQTLKDTSSSFKQSVDTNELSNINFDGFNNMTEEQKLAVMARDLNWCMQTGGNIYFLAKIGATDGKSFQQMAGSMTGMTEDEYRNMMIKGGRSVEGNRFIGENGDAQAQNQPQGSAGKKVH